MEDGCDESSHDANEEGWGTACGKATDKAAMERKKEEKDGVETRRDRGTIVSVFRFGWDVIWAWIIRSNPKRSAAQAKPTRNQRPSREGLA